MSTHATQLNAVNVYNGVRFFTATVDGNRYEIPEAWSMGYCRTHGGSAVEAARAWHEQAEAERALVRERGPVNTHKRWDALAVGGPVINRAATMSEPTWGALWWRVSLLVRLHARRIRGGWLVWCRRVRTASQRIMYALEES